MPSVLNSTASPLWAAASVGSDRWGEVDGVVSTPTSNLEKITEHGKRADGIVKAMLEHSRGSSAERRMVDFGSHPIPRADGVASFIWAWRCALPALGRIGLTISKSRHSVEIVELRASAGENWLEGWDHSASEAALALSRITATVGPARLECRAELRGTSSLHALGRFYQRTHHATDASVLHALAPLAASEPTSASFTVRAPAGGAWIGEVVRDLLRNRAVLCARTFAAHRE